MKNRSTSTSRKQPPKAEKTIRYWPTAMADRLDQPIPFAVCPTANSYPRTKVSA